MAHPTWLLIPNNVTKVLSPSGTTWSAIATYDDSYTPPAWTLDKTTGFDAQTWSYTGTDSQISDSGFLASSDKKYSIVCTAVLDEREEIIVEMVNGEAYLPSSPTKFALQVKDIYIPTDINKRITRLRFYHKVQDRDIDYMLHKEIDLIDGKDAYNTSFYISDYTNTGIALAQNIGFLFDYDKSKKYKVLTGFKSFATVGDISLALATGDTVNVYHSTVGGGNLMADLVYSESLLPISGIKDIVALCPLADKIIVFTNNNAYVISAGEALGQAVFTLSETLDLGVLSIKHVVPIYGGAIVNTRNGIFSTDGYQMQLLSRPVNDLIKSYFGEDTYVYYNRNKHELYYKYNNWNDVGRYRFEDGVWEIFDTGIGSIIDILIDSNGEKAFLTSNKLYIYNSSDTTVPTSYIKTPETDLGEPEVDKYLNGFNLDYYGKFTITFYLDGIAQTALTSETATNRDLWWRDMALSTRKPFRKIHANISTTTLNSIFYGLELDIDTALRRRDA